MAIIRALEIPDVFLTFTYNPNWLEIQSELHERQTVANRSDFVTQVFQMKMKVLLNGLVKLGWFAEVIGNIWTREYQKRGLPHIHLLLIFPQAQMVTTVEDIDRLVSAELPSIENNELFDTVTKCLLHGPCGGDYPNARCMVDGRCKKRYPCMYCDAITQGEDGYAIYRRRNDRRTFQKSPRGFVYDNRWVVPHNPNLTRKFNAHINVKVSAGIRSVKYMFIYIYKGQDRATVRVDGPINEIQQYIDARYMSASEAIDSLL
jgi:hypothetical protein